MYVSGDRPGYRSLSVGDVIRNQEVYHRVAKCGFDKFEVDKNEQEIKEASHETMGL